MQIIKLKLSELTKPERNVRIHTEQQLKEFERSVRMFGQIRPIVVDENNNILAGNGLYDTLLRMGEETAECYRYDNLSENQKKKLMIADNKIFSLGIENLDTLNAFLEEMSGDFDIPGFDEDILRQMVADADEITGKISEYGILDDTEIAGMKAKAQSMEQKLQEATPAPIFAGNPAEAPAGVSADIRQAGVATDANSFIVCPNCGEKIWL